VTRDPVRFYGFEVNWASRPEPMTAQMKNPPLWSYGLALAGSLAGFSEPVMHGAALLPALALVMATLVLACRLGGAPRTTLLALLGMPAFLVSATTVMCDVTMTALFVGSVALWMACLQDERPLLGWAAAVLAVAAVLTKYFAIALVPLLALYGLLRRARPLAFLPLLLPLVSLAVYEVATRELFGVGLVSDASNYEAGARAAAASGPLRQPLAALIFTGGGLASLAFVAVPLWGRRVGGALAAGLALAAALTQLPAIFKAHIVWPLALQMGLWMVAGAGVLLLAASEYRRRPDAESGLLLAWVAGTLLFAAHFNWTANARAVLPMAPAVAILIGRRLARPPLALLGAIGLALLVAAADARLAWTAREAARQVLEQQRGRRVWFAGHWGFQYYMEQGGALAADPSRFRAGDVVVLPSNNVTPIRLTSGSHRPLGVIELLPFPGLATMCIPLGAGFYSDFVGPLPFTFGPVPPETYQMAELLPVPGPGRP
jgi:hypothetical protein